MAVKTFYCLNTADASWGQLQDGGSAPAAAASAYGWTVAKTALGYWRGRVGAAATATGTQAATWLGAASLAQGTGTTITTASNAFRSPTALTGSFANTTWPFSFGVRTGAASHAGRIRIQIWKGANANGSGATKIGGIGIGSIATLAATATTYTTSGSVAAPGVITLDNEYLFFEVEWQGTTVGTSNSCTTLFYQGVCTFTTPDFTATITGTLADTDDPDIASAAGKVGLLGTLSDSDDPDTANVAGAVAWPPITGILADTDDPDTASVDGEVLSSSVDGTLAATDAADACNVTGLVGRLGNLAASDVVDGANLSAAVRWLATLAATETADTALNNAAVRWLATLAAMEAQDVSVIAGPIPTTGVVAALEAADTAALAASARHIATLAASETADQIAIVASAHTDGAIAAIEAADHAVFTASGFETVGETKTYFITGRAAPMLAVIGSKRSRATITGKPATPLAPITGSVLPPEQLAARRKPAPTRIAQQ